MTGTGKEKWGRFYSSRTQVGKTRSVPFLFYRLIAMSIQNLSPSSRYF